MAHEEGKEKRFISQDRPSSPSTLRPFQPPQQHCPLSSRTLSMRCDCLCSVIYGSVSIIRLCITVWRVRYVTGTVPNLQRPAPRRIAICYFIESLSLCYYVSFVLIQSTSEPRQHSRQRSWQIDWHIEPPGGHPGHYTKVRKYE